ncbi:MAG: endolytic transglycosylase MltG [Caldilineaceae bacterium]
MSLNQRRERILSQHERMLARERLPRKDSATQSERSNVTQTLLRLVFLLLVVATVGGTWVVMNAHLAEQFLGAPKQTQGLIDRYAGQGALTPEYIEQQILRFNLRMKEDDLTLPAGTDPTQRPFVINPGEPARFIAARLQEEGFVRDAGLFNLYLRVNGLERRIDAGNFILANTMNIPQIAEALQNALSPEAVVTVPEGFRAEEIADRLVAKNVITDPQVFLDAVRNPRNLSIFKDYDFLKSLPANGGLEGFLFPDTYRLPVFASSMNLVIAPFLDNFERKINSRELSGGSSGLSGRDLLTLASIVEREAVQADERPLIASVYANRLKNACPDVGGRYLQADPTVQYAKGVAGNWWWKPTDIREYSTVVSPYNTYLNEGLPPAPIANPGESAIEAARNPAATAYCFFLGTGQDGRHVFATTLAEHQQNLSIYGYQP